MVGSLVKVGMGKMKLEELKQVIDGDKYIVTDRMSAKGLCLYKVKYSEQTMELIG
jgi:tRNA U38,U39,U40 pseudouridine synthase TruA